MYIFTGGRRSGKTEKAIDWFLSNPSNRIIIAPNKRQADYLKRRILEKAGTFGDFPFLSHIVPYAQSETLLYGSRNYEIAVDNLDMLLHQLFHNTVEFATVTGVQFNMPKQKPWWKFW